jgi:hypothetical protein
MLNRSRSEFSDFGLGVIFVVLDERDKVSHARLNLHLRAIEGPALIAVVIVVATRAIVTQDLVFGDEVGYLTSGQNMSQGSLPGFSGSATYVDLYFLLSKATSDPIGLYFSMRAVSAVAFVVGVWVAARLLVGPALAWVAAATAAALPVAYVWPGVSGPAAGALLVGFALFARYRNVAALATSTGLFWLAAGSRPEFAWIALVTSVLSLVWLVAQLRAEGGTKSERLRNFFAVMVGAVGVPIALVSLHGSPFAGGRSWEAFSQHFSLRNSLGSEDPWLDSAEIVGRSFPGVDSVGQAVLTNPSVFISHVFSNVADFPVSLFHQVFGGPLISSLMVIVLFLSMLASVALRPRIALSKLRFSFGLFWGNRKIIKNILLIFVGLLFFAALAIPILVIFPRDHYLIVPAGLLILVIVVIQDQFGSPKLTLALPFALTFLLFVLLSAQVLQQTIGRMTYPAPIAKTLSLMENTSTDWRILSLDWGLNTGASTFVDSAEVVGPNQFAPGQEFEKSLIESGINAVWITSDFNNLNAEQFPGLEQFLIEPQVFGFRPIHPESNMYVKVN